MKVPHLWRRMAVKATGTVLHDHPVISLGSRQRTTLATASTTHNLSVAAEARALAVGWAIVILC